MSGETILRPTNPLGAVGLANPIVVAPSQTYLSGEEHLRVRAWCSQAGVTIQIGVRFMLPDGSLQGTLYNFAVTGDRAPTFNDIPLPRGYLLNVVARSQAGTVLSGQCYVAVTIVRGDGNAGITLAELIGGYVTLFNLLAWPGSPVTPATDGAGWLNTVLDIVGLVGATYTITVPVGARWRLNTLKVTVLTSAAVGTRQLAMALQSGGQDVVFLLTPLNIAAGQLSTITFGRGFAVVQLNPPTLTYLMPLPFDVDLIAGYTIKLAWLGFLAGDSFLQVHYQATEWLDIA